VTTGLSDAERVEAAIDKFDSAMAKRIREVRLALRRRFLTAYELVWDNYNFFVIGYSATERPSDTIVTLAADRNGVSLAFYRGADLPDPDDILLGTGTQNRFIRLTDGAATLAKPAVVALIDAAEAQAPAAMRKSGKIVTIVRSVSAKQRPRR
jgi:hypothetical protein